MKDIMENWRRFVEIEKRVGILEEKLGAPLKHLNFNPCNQVNFNRLMIQAVNNPKNEKTWAALRRLIFKTHKKIKNKNKEPNWDEYGLIRVINNSPKDIYNLTVTAWGPPWTPEGNRYFEKKNQNEVVTNSAMFKIIGDKHEKPNNERHFSVIPANQALEFLAPNKSFTFTYEVELAQGAFDIESPNEQGYEKKTFNTGNHIGNNTKFRELTNGVVWEITIEERRIGNGIHVYPAPEINTARGMTRADFERGD